MDDPIDTVVGRQLQRDCIIVLVVLVWMVCGFRVAIHKASRGTQNVWIGAQLTLTHQRPDYQHGAVTVSVKLETIEQLTNLTTNLLNNKRHQRC